MVGPEPPEVTLGTLHEDLAGGFAEMRTGFADLKGEMRAGFADLRGEMRAGFADLKGEMRAGFADLKATLVTGFRALPTRESSEEMIRLLREANRLQEDRFARLATRIREQLLEAQQVLHAVVEGQRVLMEGQRILVDSQRTLSLDLRALIARIDLLIGGRGDGNSAA
jgi:hypothetical protein